MKKLIVMSCLLGLFGQVAAKEWVEIGFNQNSITYGDLDSKTNNQALFKIVNFKPKRVADTKLYYHTSIIHAEVSCSTPIIKYHSLTLLSKSGKLLAYNDFSNNPEYDSILPNSKAENMQNFICNHHL